MTETRHDEGAGDRRTLVTRVGAAVVATLPRELDEANLGALRAEALEAVRRTRARALVIEATGLDVADAAEFTALVAVARAAAWLGARPLLVGLSAGLVGYLVDTGVDTRGLEAFATLDDALSALRSAGPQWTSTTGA